MASGRKTADYVGAVQGVVSLHGNLLSLPAIIARSDNSLFESLDFWMSKCPKTMSYLTGAGKRENFTYVEKFIFTARRRTPRWQTRSVHLPSR